MKAGDLPRFVHDLLGSCPASGGGVHNWLFRTARLLHPYRDEGEIFALLESASVGCGRQIEKREICNAVKNSLEYAWQPGKTNNTTAKRSPKWPKPNQEQVEAVVRDGAGLVDLWEYSPIRFDDGEPHTEEVIDELFPGDPLLCVGHTSSRFDTKSREEWRGQLSQAQLIVPNTMAKEKGLTKGGRLSPRSLDNTGARRFLVVECDEVSEDTQAAVLSHLGRFLPLVLVVLSGDKSVHGWFFCEGVPEGDLRKFM